MLVILRGRDDPVERRSQLLVAREPLEPQHHRPRVPNAESLRPVERIVADRTDQAPVAGRIDIGGSGRWNRWVAAHEFVSEAIEHSGQVAASERLRSLVED